MAHKILITILGVCCTILSFSQTKLTGMCIAPDGSLYIAGNNGYVSKIKDETDKFSSRFYYDQVGRLVLSQNSKQYTSSPSRSTYSYTLYDALGRPYEAGQVNATTTIESTTGYRLGHVDYAEFKNWIESSPREQVVRTYYDTKAFTLSIANFTQENLRLRVASVAYYDTYGGEGDKNNYANATHYSYDIHGNVKTLVQDNPSMAALCTEDKYKDKDKCKRIDYEYDLINGKVNAVYYQKGLIDQYAHKYIYDADNRIVEVQTSKDGVFWDRDASYKYYAHGPLARVELGEEKVQGIDYVYTLQGWIKGVNNVVLQPGRDPGMDGAVRTDGNQDHQAVAKDAVGYNLEYYTGDYKSIAGKESGNFLPDVSSLTDPLKDDLYNGNIRSMSTGIMDIKASTPAPIPQRATYRYDQLNRITEMVTRNMPVSNQWNTAVRDAYHTSYTYDANGNIKTLTRNNGSITAQQIDNLEYIYEEIGVEDYTRKTNRLRRVIDHATTYDGTANDIEAGQLKNNYEYDASGNLTKDVQEGISNIEWTVTGKVSKVTKTGDPDVLEILFAYDAMGNRISKTVVKQGSAATTVTTYYVRDASGNIMATYEKEGDDFSVAEQYIYGSQRLGYYYANKPLPACTSSEADVNGVLTGELTRGNKRYEITNHLGNVLAVVSDRKIPIYADATETSINAYKPNIINTTDYYPFGMAMKGRNAGGDNYRFGFGGQEKDEEIKGFGNHLSFGDYGYDPRTGRRCNVDPLSGKYPNISPYATFENNPIYFNDKTGQDAEVTISMGKDITISAKIYIYGAGASAAQAQKMQNAIMNDWNNSGNGWTYTDRATGEVYNVKFNVSVEVYDKKNPTNNPTFIPDSWNPISTNNYIEIGATQEDVSRSYVKGGDEGEWRGYGTDPSSHEFGHLIGLDDRYSDTNGTYLGWEGNVMGEPAGQGVVQQKNINNLVTPIINEYKESEQYEFNKGSTNIFWEYKSKIDESAPGWESSGTGTLDESTLP